MDSSSPPEDIANVIPITSKRASSSSTPPKPDNSVEVYYTVREKFPVIDLHSHARTNEIDGTVVLPKELVMRFVTIKAQYDAVHREVKSWINSSRSERGRTPL
jgi:hypothetical protein